MKTSPFASRIDQAVDAWLNTQLDGTRAEVSIAETTVIVTVSTPEPERFALLFLPSDLRADAPSLPPAVARSGAPASLARRQILELARRPADAELARKPVDAKRTRRASS